VARGVLPYPDVPPGYLRGGDGVLAPDPATRGGVADPFDLRDRGATIAEVRAFLRDRVIERSYHGVGAMLGSRVYLGEIHFGDLHNLRAYPPIVDRDVWRRVQRRSSPRGRKATSDRLLARLGVLRCATCDSRMVVGTANHGGYHLYRCPPTGDCTRRVTISAEIVEAIVVDAVRAHIADAEGRASAEANARQAVEARDRAQADLDAAIRAGTRGQPRRRAGRGHGHRGGRLGAPPPARRARSRQPASHVQRPRSTPSPPLSGIASVGAKHRRCGRFW
jgi:hypothetical protein